MRLLAVLLVIASGCACLQKRSQEWSYANSLKRRTLKLNVVCEGKPKRTGTGVALGGEYIGTAAHLVAGVESCQLLADGREAKLVATDATNDASLWRVAGARYDEVRWAEPYTGMPITCTNYSWQIYSDSAALQFTTGLLQADYGKRYRLSCQFHVGGSGGGVWDTRGDLVALTISIGENPAVFDPLAYAPGDKLFLATPSKYLRGLYDTQRNHDQLTAEVEGQEGDWRKQPGLVGQLPD